MKASTAYRGFISALVLLGLCLVSVTTPTAAQAQTTSVGPYYAMPSWDQTLPSATRFIILSNFNSAAVLDRNTGLVWEKSPATVSATWGSARSSCANKNVGNQKGWRLPSVFELMSLVDATVQSPGPTLPLGHPFTNIQAKPPVERFFYWSATTDTLSLLSQPQSPLRFGVDFFDGAPNAAIDEQSKGVWCVRGPMNADAY
jgi:hypothetical protein